MLKQLNSLRIKIAGFLNLPPIKTKFFFFNFWGIVHFFSGAILMFFIDKLNINIIFKFIILIVLLVFYEIFEFGFYSKSNLIFRREPIIDIIWDIIYGISGSIVYYLILKFV